MPVPSSVTDLSTTPSSNYPGGGESPSTLDDYHRSLCAIVRQVYDGSVHSGVATGSGLTVSATDKLLGRSSSGSGAIEEIACTAAGRALLDDANAAAQLVTLGAAASGAVTSSGLTMATSKLLGRSTASTGAIEEITIGSGLSLSAGTLTASGSQKLVQYVDSSTSAVATGTTTIPLDDTIPQNTEGDQYLSVSITPTSSSNKLLIMVNANAAHTASGGVFILALFQDSTANALAAVTQGYDSPNKAETIPLVYYMTAGTTSATTFKVRIGSYVAGTTTLNGVSSARQMGGVMASSITVMELA